MEFIQTKAKDKIKAAVVLPQQIGVYTQFSPQMRLEEAKGLALAIDLEVVYAEIVKIRQIRPATYFSGSFSEKMLQIIQDCGIELLIVDTSLTPVQQRNMEKALKIKVIDRTALILEIFGERAKTREGILQVELAHLTYQRSRLVRSWTHLERQRGGAGFLGGPGETQIELDRRIIDDKIVKLKKELEKVKKTRGLQRSSRKKVPYPTVALVGYTNAGKSMLFNQITQENVFSKDLLFATLDPTLRKIKLPSGKEAILSDTVGFISDLPHELIMSFRATLEEVLSADVIVHVIDASGECAAQQRAEVIKVLQNLGLEHIENKQNYIEVLNKSDLLAPDIKQGLVQRYQNQKNVIAASALKKEGISELLARVDEILSVSEETAELKILADNGALIAAVYRNAEVIKTKNCDEYIIFEIKSSPQNIAKLKKMNI